MSIMTVIGLTQVKSFHKSLNSQKVENTNRPFIFARSSLSSLNRVTVRECCSSTFATNSKRRRFLVSSLASDSKSHPKPRYVSKINTRSHQISVSATSEPQLIVDEEDKARAERMVKKKQQRTQYLLSAVAATSLILFTAIVATVYRYSSQTADGSPFPYFELFSSLLCTVGAAVGMEFYARYAHKYLWHETWMWSLPEEWRKEWNKPFWKLHESHHEPREGAFENNDIFAVMNAVPAFGLILYGFLNSGEWPGICYGIGLGITVFGMAYMFVHDGMIHKRFPVGPIEEVPYLKKIAAAHRIHHGEKYDGVPYGLFFGLDELEKIGGLGELEEVLRAAEERDKAAKEAKEMRTKS
mmetsp:Transcript_32095/g.44492  ORF Transcript_32095/g.44492 Transcript_32095/m.44492 type:complete len:355 (-) Transcript_32095:153-1217(-)